MTDRRQRITFTDAELDILAHALVCFDIGNHLIGAERWWDYEDTLWILQKLCWYGDRK